MRTKQWAGEIWGTKTLESDSIRDGGSKGCSSGWVEATERAGSGLTVVLLV